MRDFDISRFEGIAEDRSFRIGGELFTFRPKVSADIVAAYIDATGRPGNLSGVIEAADGFVIDALGDADQKRRWRQVRDKADPPLNLIDLQDVVGYIIEVTSGRPTESPSDSSATPSPAGTSSTDGSPSLAAA